MAARDGVCLRAPARSLISFPKRRGSWKVAAPAPSLHQRTQLQMPAIMPPNSRSCWEATLWPKCEERAWIVDPGNGRMAFEVGSDSEGGRAMGAHLGRQRRNPHNASQVRKADADTPRWRCMARSSSRCAPASRTIAAPAITSLCPPKCLAPEAHAGGVQGSRYAVSRADAAHRLSGG